MCSFEYCQLLELENVWSSIGHSTVVRGNNSNRPVAGRVWGMVVGQGPHKQKTLSATRNLVVIRGIVVDEGGRSTGALLYNIFELFFINRRISHREYFLCDAACK